MTQWIFTSSLLIAAVLFIRAVAGERLSARLRYALWGLVLLRLLIPGSIGESALSVRNWMPESPAEIVTAVTAHRVHTADGGTVVIPQEDYAAILNESAAKDSAETNPTTDSAAPVVPADKPNVTVPEVQNAVAAPKLSADRLLPIMWTVGMVMVGGVFLVTNVHFALRLRRSRRHVMTETVPVYVTNAVDVPCLFGMFRPAVYITPDVWEDSLALRHVIAHELTHCRHGDHLWSLLRCVAVTVHWYNPLVWVAVVLSQKDGELACDEGALRRLGGHERTAYAWTLMALSCVGPRGLLTAATSMAGNESDLKQRVLRIVKNPKMTVTACIVALLIAAVVGVAVFTGEPDPLRGSWYGAREEYASYRATKSLITTQTVFRDGRVRITQYENGMFEWSALYTYEVKGDVLHLERLDGAYEESYAFTWVGDNGIDLGTVNQSGSYLWCGLLSKGDPKDYVLTDDPLMEVTALTDLTRNGTWEVVGNLGWLEGAIADMLLYADVLEERPMPEQLTYSDYCYGITAVEYGKTVELIFCDGWLYRDGVGYLMGNTDEVMERISDMIWEPVGGYTDEYGNRYSRISEYGLVRLYLPTKHEYGYDRRYSPENVTAWKKAWKQAKAACVHEDATHIAEQPVSPVLYLDIEGDGIYINVYPDGTLIYQMECDEGCPWSEHYTNPEDASLMMELVAPYMEMAAESAALAAKQPNIMGAWHLESGPVAAVTELQMSIGSNHREALEEKNLKVCAVVDGCVVETEMDVYVLEDVFHIRWREGREEAIPCKLDGDTLTLYADSGTWVLRKGQLDPVTAENADIIRISRSPSTTVRLDLTDEKLAELEALLRAGMVPMDSNIIYSDEYFYKLIALEEVFGAPDVTLSDFGTLHFGGQSYELTNWEAVEALLGTLYRKQ